MPGSDPSSAACHGVPTLLVEKFSRDEEPVDDTSAETGQRLVRVTVDGEPRSLDRETARELRDALTAALTQRREFVHTAGQHREDGAYVVERRGADSSGHRKVFPDFEAAVRLYERLPAEFTAEDVTSSGVTGGRRHMLVWHFAEHPAFDCELAARQPLTARKRPDDATDGPPTEPGDGPGVVADD